MKKILIKQDGLKDCGPTCLLMIMKHYNCEDTIENIRLLTHTTQEGTTAFHILKAAQKLGFTAKAFECSLIDTIKDIIFPCVAHVTIDNSFDHFLVITRIDYLKQIVYINDPIKGTYKLNFKEFSNIWNKILLVFTPNNITQKQISCKNHFRIKKMIKPHKKLILTIIALSLIYILFSIGTSFYFKYIIDIVLKKDPYHYLTILTIIIILLFIVKNFVSFLRNNIIIHLNKIIDLSLIKNILNQLVSLPYKYYKSRTTGEIVSRISDISEIRNMLSQVLLSVFIDSIVVISILAILFTINIRITFISLIICACYLFLVFIYYKKNDNKIIESREEEAKFTSFLIESVSAYETVKGLHIEKEIEKKNINNYNKFLLKLEILNKSYNYQELIKNMIGSLGVTMVIAIGTIEVLKGHMSIGDLVTFNSLLIYFFEPIRGLVDLEPLIKFSKIAIKRINDLYNVNKENLGISHSSIYENIQIRNLNFSYNEYENILKNVSLDIKVGEKIMVLGASSSGKSTLFKLLMKYYEVDKNSIFFGKRDICELDVNQIRNSFCYVSQNELLFTDSILNNLVLDRKVEKEKIEKLCELTSVSNIIHKKRLGLHYFLEENGFNVSGGEKQRIVLARSLFKNANYLILDESMSQMDTDLERKTLINLMNYFKEKVIIFISHRENNRDLFDKVIEINNGCLQNKNC